MLRHIRKNTKLILWTLLILIVPPFVFFGIESVFTERANPVVGMIFGRKVLLSEYFKARSFTASLMNLHGAGVPDPDLLDQMTWQRLILLEEAKKSFVRVSDEQLSEAILKIFPPGGFNRKTYENFVRNAMRLSIFEFEKFYREILLVENFQDMLLKLVQAGPDEVYALFNHESETLDVRYCEIESERFLSRPAPSPKQLADYYEKSKETFRIADQRSFDYVAIAAAAFEKQVKATPAQIERYYRRHAEELAKPLAEISQEIERKLTHSKALVRARKTARKIRRAILKGKTARQAAADRGLKVENTGLFTAGNPPQIWMQQYQRIRSLFAASLDEAIEPFESGGTYYVVIPREHKPSYIPPMEEITEKVKDSWIDAEATREALEHAGESARRAASLMTENQLDFAAACKEAGEKAIKMKPFTRAQSRMILDPLSELKRAAWDQKIQEVSEPVRTEKGYAFFWVRRKLPPDPAGFEKVKDTMAQKALDMKRQRVFYSYYQHLLGKCQFYRWQGEE